MVLRNQSKSLRLLRRQLELSGNPALAITSTNTGPTIIIFTAESITVPRRKMKRISASIKSIGEPVRLRSQFSRSLIAPNEVSNQLNGPDAAMIMKTIAELRNARRKAPEHSVHLIVLINKHASK